ncbi:MAG: globin [Akkermansiaceae bacterium]|jgi:hemoglobin|tara:strand:- start:14588 stop:14959 length:372 start_codon:yes stop_codon:yes gene_type:complete
MDEAVIYTILGEAGFTKMVAAFYKRIKTDDLIKPMYPEEDMEGSEERLRDFLLFRFGNDPRYQAKRGHPRLRMRHAPFAIGEAEVERWLKLMDEAMVETNVPNSIQLDLRTFFTMVANNMKNQ